MLYVSKVGIFHFAPEDKEMFIHKANILITFSHPVEDEDLREDCFERSGEQSLKARLKQLKPFIGDLLFSKKKLKSSIKKYQNYDLLNDKNFNSSAEMIEFLLKELYIVSKVKVIAFVVRQ